ncbi:MAG: phosphoribosylformylglycinamidine synthase subunit PurL [Pseudomonadota bacterium]|jgi:phosphoribosylformylglycinamidine synthase II
MTNTPERSALTSATASLTGEPSCPDSIATRQAPWMRTATLEDAREHGLKSGEFEAIVKALGRPINMVELGISSALFSEHCSYKSTKVHLRTLPTKGPRVLVGPGENACVVDIGDNQAVVFKVESHNHPSFIEPFQGAATGVGGILRDVFTMGARPVALLNSLRFGDPALAKSRHLLRRAVNGIGFYGNCMGIPTVGGELSFHPSFNGNCLVNAFALGIVRQDEVFLGTASGVGNIVLYVGSKTGRDGIHGASMSSESFGDDSEAKRPTVQVGDPFQEKLLLEACLEAFKSGYVVGVQDMGAAGLTSSSFEMADRGNNGVRIYLDRVPQRETGMNPYEIMLSESQERMLFIVKAGQEQKLIEIFKRWELDAVAIGEVIAGGEVELIWHGDLVSRMPAQLLTSAVPEYSWPTKAPSDPQLSAPIDLSSVHCPKDLGEAWLKVLSSPDNCSRHAVYNQYDSTVRCNTVVHPGSDSGVVRITAPDNREKGIAISLDCNSRFCAIDAHRGTAHSLAEGCRNIAATGASPIGISDCLNMPSPENPETMWQIAGSIAGLGEAARAFDIPVVSGNVSLYNQTHGHGIHPTPLLAVVGLLEDVSLAVSSAFKSNGDIVLLIGETKPSDLGGSAYLAEIHGIERGALPELNYELEKRTCDAIRTLIKQRLLRSCHDVSQGGLAVALAECCFSDYSKPFGVVASLHDTSLRADVALFSESGARFVVSCKEDDVAQVRKILSAHAVAITGEGRVGGENITLQKVASVPSELAYRAWYTGLDQIFSE